MSGQPPRVKSKSRDDRDYRKRETPREAKENERREREKERATERERTKERDREKRKRDDDLALSEREKRRKESEEEAKEQERKPEEEKKEEIVKPKTEPMDIETLVKQKEEETKAFTKPVFLSKAEREKLALERRAKEVEEKQRVLEEQRKTREQFLKQAEEAREKIKKVEDPRDSERKRREDRRVQREKEERERRDKEKDAKEKEEAKEKEDKSQKELDMIKQSYLGGKKEKKKVIKPSEKFKFVFDWDLAEDTSKDLNPIYNNRHEIRPMFGRGFIAGIDQKEQIKEYQSFLDNHKPTMDDEKNRQLAFSEKEQLQKKLATLARNELPVLKHWTEKTLEQMNERDWRIFREDFNITTKGGNLPHPIRSWKESGLRKRILAAIEKAGYKEPTPIQRQAIPIALQGRDVMGIAETGSGKCLGFDTPILMHDGTVKPVQDVKVGDRLMGDDSEPRRVLSLARGREDMARITLEMGDSFTCNVSHVLSLKIDGFPGYRCDDAQHCVVVPLVERDCQGNVSSIKHATMRFSTEQEAKEVLADFGWNDRVALRSGEEGETNEAVENFKNKLKAIKGLGEVTLHEGTIQFLKHNEGSEVILHDETIDISVKDLIDPKRVSPLIFSHLKAYHVGSLKFPPRDQPLPVEPYALGYWLGEGTDSCGANNKLLNYVRASELSHAGKHIPEEYKLGSEETRLQLLAGLIDAKGHPDGDCLELCLTSERLLEDSAFVARSLGLRVSHSKDRVRISGSTDRLPCVSPSNRVEASEVNEDTLREDFKIDLLEEDEYYGFTLDGNNRFVIGGGFIVTHNTAAFVLPMLEYVLKLPKMTPETENDGPYAVIMAPTRELAIQIEQEAVRFASHVDIRCICLVGGVSIEEQGIALRRGVEVVIATPGRLFDCIDKRYIVLNQCTYVVLDEADRMIDMGFEPQVNAVLDAMPVSNLKSEDESQAAQQEGAGGKYRTTIMYSATMPTGVERLARKYLRRPAYVIIGEIGKAVDRIEQRVEWIAPESKLKKLTDVLNTSPPPPIMIFCNQKKICDMLAKQLDRQGWKATALHSGRNQVARETAMEGFKAGRYDILIATDVAARGIDVTGVTHVINYDMPKSLEDYTHRIGRTGRAGREGLATSFITVEDADIMYDMKTMLQSNGLHCPQELANHPAAQHKPGAIPDRPSRKDTIIYAKS